MTAEQLAAVRQGSYLVEAQAGQLIRNLCAEIENYQATTSGLLERIDAVRAERDAELTHFAEVLEAAGEMEVKLASALHPWQPIATASPDGVAVLGYGRHTGSPVDAQKGVEAADHWWAIMLWDRWRYAPDGQRWVFAKDGKPTWSPPTHWMPLPPPPEVLP